MSRADLVSLRELAPHLDNLSASVIAELEDEGLVPARHGKGWLPDVAARFFGDSSAVRRAVLRGREIEASRRRIADRRVPVTYVQVRLPGLHFADVIDMSDRGVIPAYRRADSDSAPLFSANVIDAFFADPAKRMRAEKEAAKVRALRRAAAPTAHARRAR